jgi:hypothetical protein
MEEFGQENNDRASWLAAVFYGLFVDRRNDDKEDNAAIHI